MEALGLFDTTPLPCSTVCQAGMLEPGGATYCFIGMIRCGAGSPCSAGTPASNLDNECGQKHRHYGEKDYVH